MTGVRYYLSLKLYCKLNESWTPRTCVPLFRGSQFSQSFASCSMLTCIVALTSVVRLRCCRHGTTFKRGPWWRTVGDPPFGNHGCLPSCPKQSSILIFGVLFSHYLLLLHSSSYIACAGCQKDGGCSVWTFQCFTKLPETHLGR